MSFALNAKKGNRDDGESETFVTHSLTSEGHDASEDGTGRGTPIVAALLTKGSATGGGVNQPGRRQEDDVNLIPISGDALRGEGTAKTPSADAEGNMRLRDPGLGIGDEGDPAFTLSATSPGGVGVRRLTPTECERLQGFPDDWTQLGDTPDSRRYSALGDAVTVNVAEWIGGRLAA